MLRSDTLARVRRALGRTAGKSIAYRVTLEREADADRETYEQRAASLTDGLEASIRDAGTGSFESLEVFRTAGPYSRTLAAIDTEKQRVADYNAWLSEFGDSGAPRLSSMTVEGVKADLDDAAKSLETLHEDRDHMMNTVVYTVSFAPQSPQTIEAITSEFNRLSTLDGIEAVERESDVPDADPRNSIDFRTQEDIDR
jgi:hypothetical protein